MVFSLPRSKERPAMRTAQMVWPLPASPAAESVRLEGTRYKDSTLPCSANSTLSLTELQHSERFCIKSFFLAADLFFWTKLLTSSATSDSQGFLGLINLTTRPMIIRNFISTLTHSVLIINNNTHSSYTDIDIDLSESAVKLVPLVLSIS